MARSGGAPASAPIRLLPMGDAAVLVEVAGGIEQVIAVHRALAADPPVGLVDLVPAARTVLVTVEPQHLPVTAVREWIHRVVASPPQVSQATESGGREGDSTSELVLPVHYDGADLAEVARLAGLTPDAVVAAHSGRAWTVAFTGFAPGFAYLVGGDERLRVPRWDTPRTVVPAGSVGLAREYCGVYPRATPGGWQLIGRTDRTIWDVAADPPALLRPGLRVRFEPVR